MVYHHASLLQEKAYKKKHKTKEWRKKTGALKNKDEKNSSVKSVSKFD